MGARWRDSGGGKVPRSPVGAGTETVYRPVRPEYPAVLAEEIRALYDAQMRRDPVPAAGSRVERTDALVRVVGEDNYVLWSDLTAEDAEAAVTAQAAYFRRSGVAGEWKTFGHDRGPALDPLLERAGFVPGEPETLVAFDLRLGLPIGPVPSGVTIRQVTDDAGVHAAVRATVAAFGPEDKGVLARYRSAVRDPNQVVFVAYSADEPVSAGRLEMTPRRAFASLWGGGTTPEHRHRGIYRALVHARGAVARSAGYRFLTVDAEETSRPILERLGFVRVTTTRGWTLPARGR